MTYSSASAAMGSSDTNGFSVTHSVITPRAILVLATRCSALDAPASCELLKQGLNDTYLLRAGKTRVIVRAYSARRGASEIAYELDLLIHLAAKDVHVPVPLAACDGSRSLRIRAPDGNRTVVFFSYAEGAPIAWSDAACCRLAGRALARIHAGADDFVSPHPRPPLDAGYLIDRPLQAVRPFLVHRPADLAYLEALGARLRARLTDEAAAGLDWGVCHGDFGAKNIYTRGAHDEAAVIDFDFCGEGWRTYDFAPIRRSTLDRQGQARWDSFLNGYSDVRPIRGKDLNAVMLFRGLRHLAMLGVFAQNVDVWGLAYLEERHLDQWLRFLRDWETQHLADRDRNA